MIGASVFGGGGISRGRRERKMRGERREINERGETKGTLPSFCEFYCLSFGDLESEESFEGFIE